MRALAPAILIIALLCLAGCTTGAEPDGPGGGKGAAGQPPKAGQDGPRNGAAKGAAPPAVEREPWQAVDVAYRLTQDARGRLFIGADAALHAGVEVYRVDDPAVLKLLIGPAGPDGRRLQDACAAAISASTLPVKPELLVEPGRDAAGLRLIRFDRLAVPDPAGLAGLPMAEQGPGLYLVCLRAGTRVAAMPVARGELALCSVRAGGKIAALVTRRGRPLGGTVVWRVTHRGATRARAGADGVASWDDDGAPHLLLAQHETEWALDLLPAVAPAPATPPRLTLIDRSAFAGARVALQLRAGAVAIWGAIQIVGPGGVPRRIGTVSVGAGASRWLTPELPSDLAPGPHELRLVTGTDAADTVAVPITVLEGYPAAALVEATFEPAQPRAGTPVTIKLSRRRADDQPTAAFDATVQAWQVASDGAQRLAARGAATGTAGAATVAIDGLSPGRCLIVARTRDAAGGVTRWVRWCRVLPASGVHVAPRLPAGAPILAAGEPVTAEIASALAGPHRVELHRRLADGATRIVAQETLETGEHVAQLRPSEAGRMRLVVVGPGDVRGQSDWFGVGAPGDTSGDAIQAGAAVRGRAWPIAVSAPAGQTGVAMLDGAGPTGHQVIAGKPAMLRGRAPADLGAAPVVVLATAAGRWRCRVPTQTRSDAGSGPLELQGWRGRLAWSAPEPGEVPEVTPEVGYVPAGLEAPGRLDDRRLYQLKLRTIQVWSFQASVALARHEYHKAAELARKILSAFPTHAAARKVLQRARLGLLQRGIRLPVKPLERLRAIRITPRWDGLPLSAIVAEIRDAAGVPIEMVVARPHRVVAFDHMEPADGDTLLRMVLSKVGLLYRAEGAGFVVESDPPYEPPAGEDPTPTPAPGRTLLTYADLPGPAALRLDGSRKAVPVPAGGPWVATLLPDTDRGSARIDRPGAPLSAILPRFLRAGDTCRTALSATGEPGLEGAKGMRLAGGQLRLTATDASSVSGTLVLGSRRRALAVPVVASGAARTTRQAALDRKTPRLTTGAPARLVVHADRLAHAIDTLRRLRPGAAARLLVARAWLIAAGHAAARRHKLVLAALPPIPSLSRTVPRPGPDGWPALPGGEADAETTARIALHLAELSRAGHAVPPTLTEPIRPLLRALMANRVKPLSLRAAAFCALATGRLEPVKVANLIGFDRRRADSLTLARVLRGALAGGDEKTARAIAEELKGRTRSRQGHAAWTAPGHAEPAVTAEVALALLARDPVEPQALDAVTGLSRRPSWPGTSVLDVAEALLASTHAGLGPPRNARLALTIGGRRHPLRLAPGRSTHLETGAGQTIALAGTVRRPLLITLEADLKTAPATRLPVTWTPDAASLAPGAPLTVRIDPSEHAPTTVRRLVVPVPPGARIVLAPTETRRFRSVPGALELTLDAGDIRPIVLRVHCQLAGRYTVPGARITDLLGRTLAAASARILTVGAPK